VPAGAAKNGLASPEAPVALSEYARTRGVAQQTVRDAIHAGKLGKAAWKNDAGDFLVLPSAADRAWGRKPRHDEPPPKAVDTTAADEAARLRRRRDELLIERELFDLDARRGRYVLADDVRATGEKIGTETRGALMGIADRIAPQVAAESDPRACHALIVAETRRVLDALADAIARL